MDISIQYSWFFLLSDTHCRTFILLKYAIAVARTSTKFDIITDMRRAAVAFKDSLNFMARIAETN